MRGAGAYLCSMTLRERNLLTECTFRATRSGGKGGQHVNKVSSRIELTFDIPASQLLSDEEKFRLQDKLASKLTTEGILRITEDSDRSQHENKERIGKKFYRLLEAALKPEKKRLKTKVPKAVKVKRRDDKAKRSEVKALRREKPAE
jgi:ribosome-associated protein